MIGDIRHSRPDSLEAALEALDAGGVPYVGGTEILAAIKLGMLEVDHLVDLKRVPGLSRTIRDGTFVHLGAAVRHADAASNATIRAALPMLAAVTGTLGNPRVRWQGTVGGNVCFAEPRSDLIPALAALGASAELMSLDKKRVVAVAELIRGPYTSDVASSELMTQLIVDVGDIRYQRYEQVRLVERPTAGVALVGRPGGWRLVVGAVSAVPLVLDISSPEEISPEDIGLSMDVIEDASGSEDYKRHLVSVLARRLRADALGEGND